MAELTSKDIFDYGVKKLKSEIDDKVEAMAQKDIAGNNFYSDNNERFSEIGVVLIKMAQELRRL